jgi:hypothetical protein
LRFGGRGACTIIRALDGATNVCHGGLTSQGQSTGRLTPVIAEAFSLARKRTARATSSGLTIQSQGYTYPYEGA